MAKLVIDTKILFEKGNGGYESSDRVEFPELWCAVMVRCRDNQHELDESSVEMGGEESGTKEWQKGFDGGGWTTKRGGEECGRRSGVPEKEMVEERSRCRDGSVVRGKRVLTIEVSGLVSC